MPISRATTAWVVSGAVGVTSFTIGLIAIQAPTAAVPSEPRPAVTVSVAPSAGPTVKPTKKPTAKPSTARPSASETADTPPSPVTPPSPESPD